MNRHTIAAVIVALALVAGAYIARPNHDTVVTSISPYEIDSYYNPSVHTVIDVRTAQEYAQATITQNPLNIDFYANDFREQLDALDRGGSYIVYCQSGNRSSQAVEIMQQMGFRDVVHLEGGISTYATLSQ